jgi:hypothetical protein
MQARTVIWLLLLALTLGLAAGPHPCRAQERPSRSAMEHSSCHGEKPAPTPSSSSNDCCDPRGGHDLCQKACQASAVLGTEPSLGGLRPIEELSLDRTDYALTPFAFSIDHIPLT